MKITRRNTTRKHAGFAAHGFMMRKLAATASLSAMALSGGAAQASTIVQTVGNVDWNSTIWGSPAAIPSSGNDYQTAAGLSGNNVRICADGNSATFLGDSLDIVSGSVGLLKNSNSTATISGALTLSGGTLNDGPNGTGSSNLAVTLAVGGFNVTAASTIFIGNAGGNVTITAPLSGSGDLHFAGANPQTADVVSFQGISGYTGAITVGAVDPGSALTGTGALALDFGSADCHFTNTFTILTTSVLHVNAGQTITFDEGKLVDPVNGTVAPGTYTTSDLGANYSGDGTIVVSSSGPKITSVTKVENTFTVNFTGIPGTTYHLNKSTNLDFSTPNVTDTVTLPALTTSGILQDTSASEGSAFYRVESQ